MHEYSLVQALFDKIDNEARQHGASAIHRVRLRIGELSGVEIDLLRSAYDVFRERTLCAEADLEILSVAASWSCPDCGDEIPRGSILRCVRCGLPARLVGGDEIVLEQIEMEVA